MTIDDIQAEMTAHDMQALTVAYVTLRGEWQASLRPRGGAGWRIATGATIAEAVARLLGVAVVSDSSADIFD